MIQSIRFSLLSLALMGAFSAVFTVHGVEQVAWVKSGVRTGGVVDFSSLLNHGSEIDVFNDLIRSYETVIVDFSATWCGPCKKMKPILQELAGEYSDALFLVIDIDKCEALKRRYGISGVPAFFLFRNGVRVKNFSGARSKAEFKKMISSL